MAEKQETTADIIAEMRGARTEFPFVYLMGEPDTPEVIDLRTKEITEPRKINIRRVTVKELADRLKAALRRERGDRAKLREALKRIVAASIVAKNANAPEWILQRMADIFAMATTALAAPPRNCDIGTAEEQAERYGRYCDKFTNDGMHCETCPCCGKIPFGKCEFAWAQMPYNEGGAK